MGRWLILFCLLGSDILILTQPLTEESIRDVRGTGPGYDFVECCPCPKSGDRALELGDIGEDSARSANSCVGSVVDCVSRSRDPDSTLSSSSDFPNQVFGRRPLLRSDESQEERMPILKPEVDLASSVLQTIKEATEEEYRDALARDAARNSAKARDPEPSDSTSNIVIIVDTPERGDVSDAVQEASEVEEARWTEEPPSFFKSSLDSAVETSNQNDNIESMGTEKKVTAANDILKNVRDRIESVRNSLNLNNKKRIPLEEKNKNTDGNILGNLKPSLPNLKDLARSKNDLTPQGSTKTSDTVQTSLGERLRNNPIIKNIHNLKDVELVPPQRNTADRKPIPKLKLPTSLRDNNGNVDNNGFDWFHLPTLDKLLHPPTRGTTIKFETKPSIIPEQEGNETSSDRTEIIDALPGESKSNFLTTKAQPSPDKYQNCDLEAASQKQNENLSSDDVNNSSDGLISLESTENDSMETTPPDEISGNFVSESFESQENDSNISVETQEISESNDPIPETPDISELNDAIPGASTNIFESIPDLNEAESQNQLRLKDDPCISDAMRMSMAKDINEKETKSSESSLLKTIDDQIKKLKETHSLAKEKLRNTLIKKGENLKNAKSNNKGVTFQELQTLSDSLLDSSNKQNVITAPESSEKIRSPKPSNKETTQILDEIKQHPENELMNTADNCKGDIFLQNSDKKEPEMETGSSNAIMNIARPSFKSRPSLRRDFIVQPSFLRRDNDAPLIDLPTLPSLDLPSFDLPSLDLPSLDLPTLPSLDLPSLELPRLDMPSLDLPSLDLPTLPSLDEIRDGIQNIFNAADTPSFMQRASEGLGSSLLPSASTHKHSLLRPLDEVNFNIFQLNPAALSRSSSKLGSLQPGFNLNSYRARVPLPDLQLKPLNLQSTSRNNGKVLGATISMNPNSNSRQNLKNRQRVSEPLSTLHENLKNLPSLGEMRDVMRSRAQDILESAPPLLSSSPLAVSSLGLGEPERLASLRENLRSNAEDAFSNIHSTLSATVQQARERNENILGTSKFAQPENVLETLALARENLDDTLKALHTDLNDRLSSIHTDGKAALTKTLKKTSLGSSSSSAPKRKTNKKKIPKSSKPSPIYRGESRKTETVLATPNNRAPSQRTGVSNGANKFKSEDGFPQHSSPNNKKATGIVHSPHSTKSKNVPEHRTLSDLSDFISQRTNPTNNRDRKPKAKTDTILATTNENSIFRPRTENSDPLQRKNILKEIQESGRSSLSRISKPSLADTLDNLKQTIDLPSSDFLRSAFDRDSDRNDYWPKSRVPDTSLLGKLREGIKFLPENSPLLGAPSGFTLEPKSVKDLLGGASQRAATALAAGPALKENVTYKCKIVCERDN